MKKYIYEREDWPEFGFDKDSLQEELAQVYLAQGRLFGKISAIGFDVRNELLLNSVSDEIVTSSAIEGEHLDMHSVRSSVARRLGVDLQNADETVPDHYTDGIVEMALDATKNYHKPITDDRLFGWHSSLFPTGRSGIHNITVGAYRSTEVDIVSGPAGNEKVHYKALPGKQIPTEMVLFLKWLDEDSRMDPFIKTAVAHLRFESIHPFDDGNGRVGRCIADLMLARAESSPKRFYSLSAQLLKERKDYYNELKKAQEMTGNICEWIAWFLSCLVRAIETSEVALDAVIQKAKLFMHWRNVPMNERQLLVVNLLFDGFEGKLTSSKWGKLCNCSHDTALRDIDDLIEKGILVRSEAGGRSTSYEIRSIVG